jgi:hypothetical protein
VSNSSTESESEDEPAGADVRWSALKLEQLVAEYWETVAPAMRADGMDPEAEHPPHRWLKADFAGLIYTLREHHDRTPTEFFREDVGITPHDGYDWELDDDAAAIALDRHVEALRERGLADATVDGARSRLAAYARRFEQRNDVSLIEPHDRETAVETLRRVAGRYVSRDAKRHLVNDVRTLYAWLTDEAYHDEHVLEGVGLDDVEE